MKLIALATALLAQHSCGLSVPSSAQMTVEGHSDWSNGKKNVWVAETDHGWGAATDEVAEERVQQIIDEGKNGKLRHGKCVRFVLLTTQKTGGLWLMNELPKAMPTAMRTGLDALDSRTEHTGYMLMKIAGLLSKTQGAAESKAKMERVGPRAWAEYAWQQIEDSTQKKRKDAIEPLDDRCAAGFKIMGPEVDSFSTEELQDVLADKDIHKIILERGDDYAHFISRQWTCLMLKAPARRGAEGFDWKQWTTARVEAGNHSTNCGMASSFNQFTKSKENLYGAWRDILRETGQAWLELKTEELPSESMEDSDMLLKINNFLLQPKMPTQVQAQELAQKEPPALAQAQAQPPAKRKSQIHHHSHDRPAKKAQIHHQGYDRLAESAHSPKHHDRHHRHNRERGRI